MRNENTETNYRLLTFVTAYSLLGLWIARLIIGEYPLQLADVLPLILLTALAICGDLFEIDASYGGKWTASQTVHIAVWILFGPAAAVCMVAVAVIVTDVILHRRPFLRVLFNAGQMTVSVGAGGIVFHALPLSDNLQSPLFLLPALASFVVCFSIQAISTALVISISERLSFPRLATSMLGWRFVGGMLNAPLATFLVFSYRYAGMWSILLYALPVYLVWRAMKMFEELKESHKNTVSALTTALEADEPYTHGHSYRVAQYAIQIGRKLKLSARDLENLEYGGLLHDIGKIAITNDIVCKPARLTKDEFDILASHPVIGGEIVDQMKFLKEVAQLVRHHHERPDGLGYPHGLKGDQISLGSHILNLADAVDAMTSNRPYRLALTVEQALDEVQRFRGTQFDARVVDAFAAMVNEGKFELIDQADGAAQRIQQILRAAAALEAEKQQDSPAYAA